MSGFGQGQRYGQSSEGGGASFDHYKPNFKTTWQRPKEEFSRVSTGAITRADLSEDQVRAYDEIVNWAIGVKTGAVTKRQLSLGGLAGTGKTTLLAAIAATLGQQFNIAFAAYTGKAANVLKGKLQALGVGGVYCGTIHGLIYGPVVHDHTDMVNPCQLTEDECPKFGTVVRWDKQPALEASLVVVDEASMIGTDMWNDLVSYGIPILAVGDHGQLPPIGESVTNLMLNPDLRLEKIHRQAEGNPILALAHFLRNGGDIKKFRTSDARIRYVPSAMSTLDRIPKDASQLNEFVVLCHKNTTRVSVNALARTARGFSGPLPDPGDLVICLRNAKKTIWNGMRGVFVQGDYAPERLDKYQQFTGRVRFPEEGFEIEGYMSQFQYGRDKTFNRPLDIPGVRRWADVGLLFDYGYTLTVHKSQGSTYKEVTVIPEGSLRVMSPDERVRWNYTAVTRASHFLNIVRT